MRERPHYTLIEECKKWDEEQAAEVAAAFTTAPVNCEPEPEPEAKTNGKKAKKS